MYRNAYIFEVGWGEDRKPVRVLVRKDQRQSDCSATNPVLHMLSRCCSGAFWCSAIWAGGDGAGITAVRRSWVSSRGARQLQEAPGKEAARAAVLGGQEGQQQVLRAHEGHAQPRGHLRCGTGRQMAREVGRRGITPTSSQNG